MSDPNQGPRPIRTSADGVLVDLLVQPNARSTEILGVHGDRIKVRVTAPPERLAANAAVCELLASVCSARIATVVAGRTTRYKTVEIRGADIAVVRRELERRRKVR